MRTGRFGHLLSPSRLRVAAAALALLAAWGPRLSSAPRTRILVRDVSASMGQGAASERVLDEALRTLSRGGRLAVVAFAETARVDVGGDAGSEPGRGPIVRRHASNVSAGLRRAASLVRAEAVSGRACEVWLVTDGLATDASGDVAAAALELRAAGCVALRVVRVDPAALPSRTTLLIGPGRVRTGEAFALEARGVAGEGGAEVELVREGEVVASRVVPAAGPFRVVFLRVETAAGAATYAARTRAGAGLPLPVANVAASEAGGALVLGSAVRPELARLLGMTCRGVPPDLDRAGVAALLAGHDLAVVDGASGGDVGEAAAAALTEYVEGGGGLLLFGGPDAFGAGGWEGALNDLSPLRSRPEGGAGLALYLALDGSGSMAEPWRNPDGDAGTRTRDEVVRAAAATLVRGLPDDSTVRIRRFADGLLPDATPPRAASMAGPGRESALATLRRMAAPGGGTSVLPVLAEAGRLARSSGASPRRHALVFTDGRTTEDVSQLRRGASDLRAAGCGLTVVFPVDAPRTARQLWTALDGLAELRLAGVAEELPAIFRDVAANAGDERSFLGRRELESSTAGAALLGERPGTAQQLNRTWTAEDATVLLWTGRDEPAAAVRNAGRGRVAALATRPGDVAWLDGSTARPIVRALRGAVQRPAAGAVRLERTAEGALLVRHEALGGVPVRLELRLDGGLDGGAPRSLALRPAGGGLLRTDADAALREGAGGWVRVLGAEGRELALSGLDRGVPPEYRDPPRADLGRLEALAGGVGGATGANAGSDGGPGSRPWLALVAVLCLVAAGVSATPDGAGARPGSMRRSSRPRSDPM